MYTSKALQKCLITDVVQNKGSSVSFMSLSICKIQKCFRQKLFYGE